MHEIHPDNVEIARGRPFRGRLAALPWIALVLLLHLPALAAAQIRFDSPRSLTTVLGPTTFELEVELPAGVEVKRIEVSVNEQPLVTLTQPPWSGAWDAGDGVKGNRLEARMFLSDGSIHRAVTRTSRLRINQFEEVGLVNIYPIVRSPGGGYITDLTRGDFRVFERGVAQTITRFSREPKPLRIGIVLDTSRSMGRKHKIEAAREAALEFLGILSERDQAMLVTFDDEVQTVQELTSDTEVLAEGIRSTDVKGGTALYDGIWRTARALRNLEGRRVLVVLSDGKDEAYDGFGPGSLHTLDEAMDQALRSEVMVFAIGLGRGLDRDLDFDRQFTLEQILRRLAENTGGRTLIAPRAGQLRKAFRSIADDLRNQYSLAYTPQDATRDGKWREIRVDIPGRRSKVVSRKGYFASPSGASR